MQRIYNRLDNSLAKYANLFYDGYVDLLLNLVQGMKKIITMVSLVPKVLVEVLIIT